MPENTIDPTPIYWDGESAIILKWEAGELPYVLVPSDEVPYVHPHETVYKGPNAGITAEEFDRRCTEANL
jgi:hypothetical protein